MSRTANTADALLARLRAKRGGVYLTEHVNRSEAAVYLDARDGSMLYNRAELRRGVRRAAAALAARGAAGDPDAVRAALAEAGREAVAFHKRYTGQRRAALRRGGPTRPVRGAGYADRSGETTDEYAVFVDRRPVTDLPGPEGQDLR